MPLVGPGLRDDVDVRAHVAAFGGGVVVGHDAHFLDRIDAWRELGSAAAGGGVHAHAVDVVGVGIGPCTVGIHVRRASAADVINTQAASGNARLQDHQVEHVPVVERQLADLVPIDGG